MKKILQITFICISVAIFVISSSNILLQIKQHVDDMHPDNTEIIAYFSGLFIKFLLMTVFVVIVIAVVAGLWLGEYRKSKIAKQLRDINDNLIEKQYKLEEQNTIIEELNAQLEEENKRYLQQKEILQAIIDSFGAGIIMVDLQGKIIFINKAWKQIFNYLDSARSCHLCENFYINDETCGNTEIFIKNMLTGMENSQEIASKLLNLIGDCESRYAVDLEQKSPVRRFLNLYSNPCISHANHCFGRVFVVRDISHQKEVDRLKTELINTVSHELRTPMSSILGFSELLLTRNLTEERSREYIGIINSEAKRLTDLINDFLDMQRMESGKQIFDKKLNSMDRIIDDVLKLFGDINDKHTIVYQKSPDDNHQVYCDRDKMIQLKLKKLIPPQNH
ncbi:MAG: histidine kinase dimerization/phospho-acceptor domain-containing protein [Caulobacteraceae bacterium]